MCISFKGVTRTSAKGGVERRRPGAIRVTGSGEKREEQELKDREASGGVLWGCRDGGDSPPE